jgi:hypothetical protein
MLTTQEKLEAISRIIKRQADTEEDILQGALDASSIDTDYYGEIRGVAMQMAAFALKQKEERDALFAIINADPTPTV